MPPRSAHFNGSVNLPNAETVIREICSRIPGRFRRITDGETGERGNWIAFQIHKFSAMPQLEPAGQRELPGENAPRPRLRLRAGVRPEDLAWPDPGYAAAYRHSFDTFETLRDQGIVPAGVRFQMQYPTPLAPIAPTIVGGDLDAVVASYERTLFADLEQALSEVPHDLIAVQWDVALEFAMLVGAGDYVPPPLKQVAHHLARCVDRVPAEVPVGMHLCYGDAGHRHFSEPESLELQVRVANAISDMAGRAVNWFSFTVPQQRNDDAYFAALSRLRVDAATELAFGLVPYHPAEQAPGTTAEQVRLIERYLARSRTKARDWAICTECGMGRAHADEIPALLDTHRTILETYGNVRPTSVT